MAPVKGSFAGVKDQSPKFTEQRTLKRLRKEISNRVLGRTTALYRCLLFLDPIGDEEVSHVDMLRSLARREFPILLQEDGALVVLVDDVLLDFVALSM